MKGLLATFSVILLLFKDIASSINIPCCEKKIVDGYTYTLSEYSGQGWADPNCKNDCVYTIEGSNEQFFCFKNGQYIPECIIEKDLAIIVTGKWKNELLYANGTKFCKLPDFPERRYGHSQHGLTSCGGQNGNGSFYNSCMTLTDGGWADNEVSLLDKRYIHLSFLRPDGKIQLMSGHPYYIDDGKSTEVVDLEAKTSVPGYDLNRESDFSCGIQHGDYFVITGVENEVYDINGFVEELPSLNTPRKEHGCGHYKNNDDKVVYLVTGGYLIYEYLDSTELLIKGDESWIISEKKLPTGRFGLVGISINNKIFMIGGDDDDSFLDEVIEFNTNTEEWSLVGNMRDTRSGGSTSLVDINIAKQFCLD